MQKIVCNRLFNVIRATEDGKLLFSFFQAYKVEYLDVIRHVTEVIMAGTI